MEHVHIALFLQLLRQSHKWAILTSAPSAWLKSKKPSTPKISKRHLLRISYVKRNPKTHIELKMPNTSTKLLTKGIFSKINIELSKINF